MWWTIWAGCSGESALVNVWHRSFRIDRSASADETDGDCEPELSAGGTDAPYGFLAVSVGLPNVASLYLCDGPSADQCPTTPIGNVWIREWTDEVLAGETGVNSVFGDLCTLVWDGIDATRTPEGELHLELRHASREVSAPLQEDCDDALDDLVRSSCDSVLVLDGLQE